MVLHFYFHFKPFLDQTRKERYRERERKKRELLIHRSHPSTGAAIYLAPPPRSHHHRRLIHPDQSHPTEDRSTQTNPPKIASPQTDPPKTDLIGAIAFSSLPITELVAFSSLPITQTDLSLSLHF